MAPNKEKQMRKNFLLAPIMWTMLLAALIVAWATVDPATLVHNFDQNGYSPFELATVPFFIAIVPMVWWQCPFVGSKARRTILCLMVSIVALMAVVKEMDLHLLILQSLYPEYVGGDGSLLPGLYKPNGEMLSGTPFKMRVLTNGGIPLNMKLVIVAYFTLFFGTFAAGFVYLLRGWLRGVFTLVPSAWAIGCFGVSGVMVQVADRLPSWLNHRFGLDKGVDGITCAQSLCTVLEEGGEMMIALFALLAIYLGCRERPHDRVFS